MPSIRLSIQPRKYSKAGNVKFLLSTLWAFLVLYQPPLPVSIIYLLTGASFAYLALFARKKINHYVVLLLPFTFMFCMLLAVNTFNGNSISSISHLFWLWVCIIPAGLVFSSISEKSFDYIVKVLITAASLQGAIAYACLLSPTFQTFIFKIMQQNGLYSSEHIAKWGYRIYGYGNSLMYSIPVSQAVIAAMAMVYGILRKKTYYSFLSLLIIFVSMINAKTSVFVFLGVLIICAYFKRRDLSRRSFRILIILICFVVLLNIGMDFLSQSHAKLFKWLGLIRDYSSIQDNYMNYYTDATKWILPEGLSIVWGTGEPRPNADVDMGFVNDVWIGGILYTLFTLFTVVYAAYLIRKKPFFDKAWAKGLSCSFLVTYLIANTKGSAFSYSSFMALFVMVALFGYRDYCVRKEK